MQGRRMHLIRSSDGSAAAQSNTPSQGQVVHMRVEVCPIFLCFSHRTYHISEPQKCSESACELHRASGGNLSAWCESGPVFRREQHISVSALTWGPRSLGPCLSARPLCVLSDWTHLKVGCLGPQAWPWWWQVVICFIDP